jgi:hypothetical protein
MNKQEVTLLDLFNQEVKADCSKLVEYALSGKLGGFTGMPTAVAQTAEIYMRLGFSGRLTVENTQLLRQALLRHLEISQNHSRLWVHPDPDAQALAQVWQEQGESLERWNQFMEAFHRIKDLKMAYDLAFDGFPSRPLQFRNDEARLIFMTMLKNEQQAFIGKQESVSVFTVKINDLAGNLEPTHARLFDLLWDGEPHPIKALLLDLFGSRTETPGTRNHLSRRISELNHKLKEFWGQPPEKSWIQRCQVNGRSGYRLFKGKVAH